VAVLPEFVDAADVPVPDLPRELDLAPEAPDHVHRPRDLGAQDLEGDDLVELAVLRLVDDAHPAPAQRLQDLVAPGEEGSLHDHEEVLATLETRIGGVLVRELAARADDAVKRRAHGG
jgi:hypothetical protein